MVFDGMSGKRRRAEPRAREKKRPVASAGKRRPVASAGKRRPEATVGNGGRWQARETVADGKRGKSWSST